MAVSWLINGGDPNYLLNGMILQVATFKGNMGNIIIGGKFCHIQEKIATISQLINGERYVIGRVLKTSTPNITIFGETTLGFPVSGRGICSWLVLPSVLSFALPTRCAKGGWEEFSMENAWKIYVLARWANFTNIFYFHPYLGKWSNFTNIFQLGWNHQLARV